jgi:hypothetical protein
MFSASGVPLTRGTKLEQLVLSTGPVPNLIRAKNLALFVSAKTRIKMQQAAILDNLAPQHLDFQVNERIA